MSLDLKQVKERFQKIKLIVSDVDGTLLNNSGIVPEENLTLIESLPSRDINFTLATQRVYSSVFQIAQSLKIKIPIITLNGAYIRNHDGSFLQKFPLKQKTVEKAIDLADKYFVKIALCHNDKIVYTENNSVVKDFMQRIGTTYELVPSYNNYLGSVVEIIMSGNDKNAVKYIQEKLSFPLSFFVTGKYYRSHSMNKVYSLEIKKSGISKKSGLKILAKHLGVKKNEVAVFGDWYNDRDLFEFGGLNIALNNAVPELKRLADFVTEKTNDESGVGHFLSQMFKG